MNSLSHLATSAPKRNLLQGLWQFWFKDLGSVSFLVTGLLSLPVALAIGLSLEGEKALQVAALMLNMGIVSTSCAIAWQGLRLQASEWAVLVPHYREHIFSQMALIGFSFLGLGLACIYLLDAWQLLASLSLMLAASGTFIALCQKRPNAFNLSILLYLSGIVATDIAAFIPSTLLMVFNVLAGVYLCLSVKGIAWHADAKSVYLNSTETGWMWLPSFAQGKVTQAIQKFFMPINFFIGPMFLMPLVLIPLTFLGLHWFGDADPQHSSLFVFIYLNSILCILLHWSRIMRWQGMQTLYLLPIFHGWQGFAQLMYRSQLKLLMLICVTFALVTAVTHSAQASLAAWLTPNLVNVSLCALSLGLGSLCRTVRQIALVFIGIAFGVVLISVCLKEFGYLLSTSVDTVFYGYSYTLVASGIFSLLGLALLSWGSASFARVKIT
ncbi:conserved hypothetical protein [Shewanella denitrificans OS217]|jgi:hypothetical protein|uniref:Uncharacterized protein n=1 Tax=Shewanella denitrificans (strain OS217 / ATCC BAA-1090 / DSM 15013) TaxID=318161 RepID=Q12T58_SHEDO|nr:hypothetical protein [Shewanella denitrificans]ABE53368.1 conserved hypothetical protein [Shewanella denitrificans OS217]